jgi:5-hydroxyisourate hydrolase-like protein (transthyretin family)
MMAIGAALAIVLIAAIQAPQAPQPSSQPAPTGRISGVVTDSESNKPLPNVMVRAIRWEGGSGQSAPPVRTDTDGRFTIAALRAGEYGLSFTAETFVTLDWGQKRPNEIARRVQLSDGQLFEKADMALPRTTAIEGRLLDEFGDPAPGMTVQAARVQYAAGKNRLMIVAGAQSRPTDDLGQFRIFNLPPSDYYLVALSGQFAGPEEAAGFALTYFPGTAVPLDAKPVSLELGQDATGIVFQMVPAEMSTVSGVTVDETGKPIPATLMLSPTSGGDIRATIMARLQSGPDGSFVIRNVPEGTYALQGFGRQVGGGGNLGNSAFGALQIKVDGDQTNLTVKIAPGATLRGRIIFEGGAPPPPVARVRVMPQPVNFATGPLGGGPPESVTSDDGTFETKNMTGSRVISVSPGAPGWMLKRVERDGKDITDRPIDFAGVDVNGIEITMTSNIATVTGTVTEAGQPAAECVVLLFAADATKWTFPSRFMTVARPNANGEFTTAALPAGDYLAIAVPPMQGQDWQDPMNLQQYRAQATSVTVLEGGKASVALRLTRR